MRTSLGAFALTVGLAAMATLAQGTPQSSEVPEPDYAAMEPPVERKLRQLYRTAAEATSPVERARAYGELGRLCRYFQLMETARAALENAAELAPEDLVWPYLLATIHQEKARYEAAATLYRRVLELEPRDLASLVRLGQVETARNRHEAAAALFAAVLEIDATSAAAAYGLGRLAAAAGRFADAVGHFEDALTRQPGANAIHYSLGLAYRQLGKMEKAREHLGQYGKVEVGFPDPLVQERPELELGSAGHLVRGNQARQRGDYRGAIAEYRQAVAADASSPEARRTLAVALMKTGDNDGAAVELVAAVELDPESATLRYNLGRVLVDLGRLDEAVDAFQAAVERAPDYSDARFNLALALAGKDRYEEALGELESLLELDPWDQEVRVRYATVLESLKRFEAAEAALRQVLTADPENREARDALARGKLRQGAELGRQGSFAAAATAYREAIDLAPDHRQARFAEATALIFGERYAEARRRLEEAAGVLPDEPNLVHVLARLLATCPADEVRDGERALGLARRVFQATGTPDHAETVAMALAELGRFAEAASWQQRILAEAQRAGRQDLLDRMSERLALYQARQPVRAPWRRR